MSQYSINLFLKRYGDSPKRCETGHPAAVNKWLWLWNRRGLGIMENINIGKYIKSEVYHVLQRMFTWTNNINRASFDSGRYHAMQRIVKSTKMAA